MADQKTTIPKGWKMTTLGEVAEKIEYGYTESATNQKIGPKFLRITDIQDDFINWETVPYCLINDKDFEKYKLSIGDIVIARTGNSTGAIATIKNEIRAVFASYLIRFKLDKERADYRFIDFLLRSRLWGKFVMSIKGGSAQGGANAKDFSIFPISLPPLSEQRAIASVLSSFDDKIELLREQNKTLESIAQTIFKEWFVNFNFPDENGKPYKASGGKMIDSELGEIPEGWRVKKMTDIFDFIKGSEPGASNYSNEKVNENFVPFYRVQDLSQYGNVPDIYVEEKLLKGKIFDQDDVLISLDGTIGRVFIGGSGGHSGGIRRVIEKQDYIKKSLIFCFLKSAKFQNDLESFSGAETTIKHAGGAIEHIKFILDEKVCKKFGEMVDPLFQKIILNISQIQTLSSLRDALLPKLMKGEIRVKGFDN